MGFRSHWLSANNRVRFCDQVTMVNEMALLNVTLRVGTDQTLYIVALGKKVTVASNLMEVRTIKELENLCMEPSL